MISKILQLFGQHLSTRRRFPVIRPNLLMGLQVHPLALAGVAYHLASETHPEPSQVPGQACQDIRTCPVFSMQASILLITCTTVQLRPRRPQITMATTICSCWQPRVRQPRLSGPQQPAITMDLNVRCTVKKLNKTILEIFFFYNIWGNFLFFSVNQS